MSQTFPMMIQSGEIAAALRLDCRWWHTSRSHPLKVDPNWLLYSVLPPSWFLSLLADSELQWNIISSASGGVSSNLSSVKNDSCCYKLLKSLLLIGYQHIYQWYLSFVIEKRLCKTGPRSFSSYSAMRFCLIEIHVHVLPKHEQCLLSKCLQNLLRQNFVNRSWCIFNTISNDTKYSYFM